MALTDNPDSTPPAGADDAWFGASNGRAAADEEAPGAESPAGRRRASTAAAGEACLRDCIARVVRQDQQALAELYETMAGRVYGLALRITRQVQTAEEVTEDCFWQVWRLSLIHILRRADGARVSEASSRPRAFRTGAGGCRADLPHV